jgi:cobalt-zinc-cadmium efflux system outer membrane protein
MTIKTQGPRASSRGRSPDASVRRARRFSAAIGTRPAHALLAILLASSMGAAHAVDSPSFNTLLQQAQANAPALLEQAANVRAAADDVRQSRAWLNPTLSASAENVGVSQAGISQRENTYSVTQVFETGGKRAARIAAEEGRSLAVGARERQARIVFAGELAIAYATAEAMQQRNDVAQAELARAADDLRAAEALVRSGREAQLRLAQAAAAMAAAQAGAQVAGADQSAALERLGALVGATEPFTRVVQPLMSEVRSALPDSEWSPAANPAFVAAGAERDALAAQVRVEQKRWMPDIGVSVGMRKYGWTDDRAATIGLTASIPLFDRNKAGIEAARERAVGASMRLEAARLEATATHRAARNRVRASDLRLQAAEQGERAANEAYRLGRIGYDAGRTSLLELLAIRRALSEAQQGTIEARLDRVRALATLSMAEGRIAFGEAP